jgi:1-acyl-sn-glycerol-3-phosphate acyltransferase
MRTVLVILALVFVTPVLAAAILIGALFGVRDRAGSVYDWAPRLWARSLCAAAGVKIRLHGAERIADGEPRIYASNHVSWYDVFTLASILPRYKFVGKAELFRIPLFGIAARAAGMIPIERENRTAAVDSLQVAGQRISAGASVVMCPEGTRGTSYALRPFKKGPFVLAIGAGVPVVPTIVHGTMEVMPKGSFRIRSGVVDIHFLDEIPTGGLTYDDRDQLSHDAWEAMAGALQTLYGIESPPPVRRVGVRG